MLTDVTKILLSLSSSRATSASLMSLFPVSCQPFFSFFLFSNLPCSWTKAPTAYVAFMRQCTAIMWLFTVHYRSIQSQHAKHCFLSKPTRFEGLLLIIAEEVPGHFSVLDTFRQTTLSVCLWLSPSVWKGCNFMGVLEGKATAGHQVRSLKMTNHKRDGKLWQCAAVAMMKLLWFTITSYLTKTWLWLVWD